MTREDAQVIATFISRASLQPNEINAYLHVSEKLQAIIDGTSEMPVVEEDGNS